MREAIARGYLDKSVLLATYEDPTKAKHAEMTFEKGDKKASQVIGVCVCGKLAYRGVWGGKSGNTKKLCPDCYARDSGGLSKHRSVRATNARPVARLAEVVPLSVISNILKVSYDDVKLMLIGKKSITESQADTANAALRAINNRTFDQSLIYPDDPGVHGVPRWVVRDIAIL